MTLMSATGEAAGRDADGRIVFVADAIPGENVEVEIVEEGKRWRRGLLRKLLEASPDRVDAACPHFGPSRPIATGAGRPLNANWERAGCGGCHWQHIDYGRQLELKRQIVVDAIARHGRPGRTPKESLEIAERLVLETVAIADGAEDRDGGPAGLFEFGYRTRMEFGLSGAGRLDLAGREGDRLAIDSCPLHHPRLAELFAGFQVQGADGEQTGRQGAAGSPQGSGRARDVAAQEAQGWDAVHAVTLAAGGGPATAGETAAGALVFHGVSDDPPAMQLDLPLNVFWLHEGPESTVELLVGDWDCPVEVSGRTLVATPPLRAEPVGGHILADEALAAAVVEVLELKTFEHLLELGAGVGARAFLLAEHAATVVAVEETELAAAALRANLAVVENADAWQGETLPTIRKLRRGEYHFDAALLTPPQGEVEAEAFSLLTRMRVRRCGLITEEPLRLARALEAVDEAGYRLAEVQPVDLHPQQPRVTLVARFDRK